MLKITPDSITRHGPEVDTPEPADYVAVYGTLRTQVDGRHGRSATMPINDYEGLARISGLRMHCSAPGSVPFTVIDPDNDKGVVVELYKNPDRDLMRVLDGIEGSPMWYARTHVQHGDSTICLYTVLEDDLHGEPLKEDGDWANWESYYAA